MREDAGTEARPGWAAMVAAAALAAAICSPPAARAQEAKAMPATTTVTFRGIRPTDPGGRDGLRNPERGLRIETLFAEPPGQPGWGPAAHLVGKVPPGFSDEWWIYDARAYEPWGLTLAQTYVYLDRYLDGPIPPEKLKRLQASFDALRRNGLKALLRFAYERDMSRKAGPTVDRILEHIRQLTPILRRNSDVIYVMQAGFVGAWGEWHSSAHGIEADHAALAKIVAAELKALPADRDIQVRVPKYKRWVLDDPILGGFVKVTAANAHTDIPAARIGFHNDGFLAGATDGGTWTEPPHFGSPGNPDFDYMTEESPYVPVDGELFWSDTDGRVDGMKAAVRLRLHHYTSLSLAHSYSGREGKPYGIDQWIRTPMTAEQAKAAKLPFSPAYFEDDLGHEVARTQFEYIRDHLGYRLELEDATWPATVKAGGRLGVQIHLINRGFAAPINPRPVFVALVGDDGTVHALATDADPRTWQPFQPGDAEYTPLVHTISLDAALPAELAPGAYRIGLWMPDAAKDLRLDPDYAVRVANGDTLWWTDTAGHYGINVMGSLTVAK